MNEEFLTDGGWLQAPFLLAWLGVSMLAVRRALAPLKQVSRVAENIDPSTADTRLPTSNVPTELLPLGRGLDAQEAYIHRTLDLIEKNTGIRSPIDVIFLSS